MTHLYTAQFKAIDNGFVGQLVEWPEVTTEGSTLAECRDALDDALHQMVQAYLATGKPVPPGNTKRNLGSLDTTRRV